MGERQAAAMAVLRPHATAAPRRRGLVRAAAMLAAAPLVAAALRAAETMVFVALPGSCLGMLRSPAPAAAASRIPRAAGSDATPGGKPVLDGLEPEVAKGPVHAIRRETVDMQMDRTARMTEWLRTLKGKFVPYGPKPWHKHRFMKVNIQVRLDTKQASNTKIIQQCTEEVRRIAGKHPYVTKARTNINALGLRKGMNFGVAVTLYGAKMMDFLYRLNTLILPRVRDFEGLYPTSFDSYGNFMMTFENQEPFRELDELVDQRELVHGFDIIIVNNCFTQPDGLKLMKDFGFPFGEPRPYRKKQPRWMMEMKGRQKAAAKKAKR